MLIGLQIDLNILFANWEAILVAIAAVLVARAVVIYGLSWIAGRNIPLNWKPILFWGGLRGAISLALALGLPFGLGGDRNLLQAMAFGVVLFTLLVQGISMEPLVRRFKLVERSETKIIYERRHARVVAARAAYDRLKRMHEEGLISDHSWAKLSQLLKKHVEGLIESLTAVLSANPTVELDEIQTARVEALQAQRSALNTLFTNGVISAETYSQLTAEVDTALANPDNRWASLMRPEALDAPPVDRLIAAIVQEEDVGEAERSLSELGLRATRLPSTGGFLGRENVTLLFGLPHSRVADAIEALKRSCRSRIEMDSRLLEELPIPLPQPKKIVVSGATLFMFEVERFFEI